MVGKGPKRSIVSHTVLSVIMTVCLVVLSFPTESLVAIAPQAHAETPALPGTALQDNSASLYSATNQSQKIPTIIFDGNGASAGSMDDLTVSSESDPVQLPKNTFSRDGYEFSGWSTTASGKDEREMKAVAVPDATTIINWAFTWDANEDGTITDDEHYTLTDALRNDSLTLYAQWKPVSQENSSSAQNTATGSGDSSSSQSGKEAAKSSYVGVESNNNDMATVRDIENGGADELNLTVRGGNAAPFSSFFGLLRSPNRGGANEISSGDGNSIDSLSIQWITSDTINDGSDSNLYLVPNDNSKQTLTAQIDFSLSGEHDYAPGTIQVKIPAYIFKDRSGKTHGNLVLPLAESPSTLTDFNWSYIDDSEGGYYILSNTRSMSAVTQVAMQLAYENITPSEIIDNEVSSQLNAEVSLVTVAGNTLKRSSSNLTAQINTYERVRSANKKYRTYKTMSADEMRAAGVDIPDDYRNEEKFLVVTWYTYAYHEGNTNYSMTWEDMPSDKMTVGIEERDCFNFIIENASGTEEENLWRRDGTTAYKYVKVAYPFSQFSPSTTYKLSNSATWTCTETDDGSQTTASATETFNFSYQNPQNVTPTGHFYHEKWGADNDSSNTTHTNWGKRPGIEGWNGCFGLYPDGVNQLARKGHEVDVCYEQYLRGYILPWTLKDGEDGNQVSDFGAKNVTMSLEDGDISFTDAPDSAPTTLEAGTDFDFKSLKLTRPTIWKAVEYDATDLDQNQIVYDNGQQVWTGDKNAYGGSYGVGYVKDDDASHIPN
ncbi:MAG: InlB B-repeat-containing protein, partial [Eggerthellaceae bacterium]